MFAKAPLFPRGFIVIPLRDPPEVIGFNANQGLEPFLPKRIGLSPYLALPAIACAGTTESLCKDRGIRRGTHGRCRIVDKCRQVLILLFLSFKKAFLSYNITADNERLRRKAPLPRITLLKLQTSVPIGLILDLPVFDHHMPVLYDRLIDFFFRTSQGISLSAAHAFPTVAHIRTQCGFHKTRGLVHIIGRIPGQQIKRVLILTSKRCVLHDRRIARNFSFLDEALLTEIPFRCRSAAHHDLFFRNRIGLRLIHRLPTEAHFGPACTARISRELIHIVR